MAREKIIALGKKMTDRIPYKLGLEKLTESRSRSITALSASSPTRRPTLHWQMGLRKPTTPEKIAKKMGKPVSYVQEIMDALATQGRSGV